MAIKNRNIILIMVGIWLLYFLLVDLRELIDFFKFDVNAPDLTDDGTKPRKYGPYPSSIWTGV